MSPTDEKLLLQSDYTPKEAARYIRLITGKERSHLTLLVHSKNFKDTKGRKGIRSHKRGHTLLIDKADLDNYIAKTMGNVGSKVKTFGRVICQVCKQDVPINGKGKIMRHGYGTEDGKPKSACKGTGRNAK